MHLSTLQYGPEAYTDGTMARDAEALFGPLRPEAMYFLQMDGQRTGLVFFDMQDPAQMVAIAEACTRMGSAHVQFMPVMNTDDLQAGMERVGKTLESLSTFRAR